MSEGGKKAVAADDQVVDASEARALKRQVREQERLLLATRGAVAQPPRAPAPCADRGSTGKRLSPPGRATGAARLDGDLCFPLRRLCS